MKYKLIASICSLFLTPFAQAQIVPAPAQSEPTVITGVTAHLGNGAVLEDAYVGFEEGRITFIGDAESWPGYDSYRVLDHSGQHLYPGFIAPNTNLGLSEIAAVRSTRDYQDVGDFNPNVRALIAYNTDSELIPTVRSNGILLAQIVPQGGRIAGSSSIMQLDAWNWEDAVVHADQGIHLYWPAETTFDRKERRRVKNKNYDPNVQELQQFLTEAQAYTKKTNHVPLNLKFEAMREVFTQRKSVFVHTESVKGMQEAVLLLENYKARCIIVGGRDAWMIPDFLKEHNVAVILPPTHRLPARPETDIDQPFKTPAILEAAGVLYCFSDEGNWRQFNLPFQAGHAVGYGLDSESAVQALTLNTARILGIEADYGTIEPGKSATFFISAGDALDMRTNQLTRAYIDGREINLDNRFKKLYEKYRELYQR